MCCTGWPINGDGPVSTSFMNRVQVARIVRVGCYFSRNPDLEGTCSMFIHCTVTESVKHTPIIE